MGMSDYEPFGTEWEKEMMKMTKVELIDFIRQRLTGMPVAWLHIMDNADGTKANEPMKVLTFSQNNPFGTRGINYDAKYKVISKPLYLKA